MDLELDALNDVLNTLRTIHESEAPDVPFDRWLNSKDDDYFKRLEYAGGGKVIKFLWITPNTENQTIKK